jgi:hypothetical protein
VKYLIGTVWIIALITVCVAWTRAKYPDDELERDLDWQGLQDFMRRKKEMQRQREAGVR